MKYSPILLCLLLAGCTTPVQVRKALPVHKAAPTHKALPAAPPPEKFPENVPVVPVTGSTAKAVEHEKNVHAGRLSVIGSGNGPVATPVTLAWDANQEPVAGYKVYHSLPGGSDLTILNVGKVTTATLSVVPPRVFRLVAYNTASLESTFSNAVTYPSALPAVSLSQSPSGTVTLNFTGPVGFQYNIYRSEDLITWVLAGQLDNQTGTMTFDDPSAGSVTHRFYRAVAQY